MHPNNNMHPNNKKSQPSHNLDISVYTFEEILALFGLNQSFDESGLKEAKRKTLLTHPDKSRLPPEYFQFYSKAYSLVENYYKSLQKMETNLTDKKFSYKNDEFHPDMLPSHLSEQQKTAAINEYFQRQYESKTDPSKFAWFKSETPVYDTDQYKGKNINDTFKDIKQKQKEMGLVKYTGVKEYMSNIGGRSFFEDEDDNTDTYASSDPFGKLKYDDVRRVHKDNLVMDIDETDIQGRATYRNVDEFANARKRDDMQHRNISVGEFQDAWRIHETRKMQENSLNYHKKDFISQKKYLQ